jgi:cysteine desulfuration protein SufE
LDFSPHFDSLGIHVILAEKQQRLCDDLLAIEDLHERLTAVVSRARRSPALTPAEHNDSTRVHGCVSVVWLLGELRDGRCYFRSDAEGPLVRGLVTLLCDFFSGATPEEIIRSESDPLAALQLLDNLSPTRRHGLTSVRAAIMAFAAAHQRVPENP